MQDGREYGIAERLDRAVPGRGAEMETAVRARLRETLAARDQADEPPRFTPLQVQNVLIQLVGCFVPIDTLASRSLDERYDAVAWAMALEENRPVDRPEWLPPRDAENALKLQEAEHTILGGLESVAAIYNDRWKDKAPSLAEMLEPLQLPRFEYRVDIIGSVPNIQDTLNEFGDDGWELVAILPRSHSHLDISGTFIFKREKE